MMINLNVKVKGGPRTPIEVEVYWTAVNEKVIRFANGQEITGEEIADWITDNLTHVLEKIQKGFNQPEPEGIDPTFNPFAEMQ